ncbi:hypothetical protein PENANT_c005G10894 [Penicillium antarcticum]|uniref:Uncharacterized protein n=1 Tax=Penicillium antarcticum TaxID=416450 RepID=A0A1V6QEG0_9EURO|nr:uncharacterized protein N7508_007862 [Penicillium antarcticum]KAJ5297613.1 hypothetical protein N7508_007862 [Penicillium antarcticum]OQD87610.1 hypothetical protein PENANT_c005G10894 [Penicillium antarcticum]
MPVDVWDDEYTSEDSEFSETDVSLRRPGRRTHIRQRSTSRHHHAHPEVKTFLAPAQPTRMHRSASTGGRRRERDPPQNPTVMIFNDQAQRSENKPSSRRVQHRVSEHNGNHFHDEDILQVPQAPPPPAPAVQVPAHAHHHSRERSYSSVSRDASPMHFHRDHELVANQHSLERNDIRQDMDLWKHQLEIERLERELARTHERAHKERPAPAPVPAPQPQPQIDPREAWRLHEEEAYEAEMRDRLRKLDRYERKYRDETSQREAEERLKLKRFEEAQRAAAEEEEVKHKLKEERLKEIARLQEEKEERSRLVREEKLKEIARLQEEKEERDELVRQIKEEEARQAREDAEKRAKEMAMKAAAVEEWKLEQERMKQRQREEAARKDKEFRDRLRIEFGYTEEEIEAILKKKNKEEKKEKKEEKKEDKKEEKKEEKEKATWIKVHRKHLLPETLLAYGLPWDWDEHDSEYIIIKKWINEDLQEELFAHTIRIRHQKENQRVIAQTSHSMTELRVNDRNKDKMFLVRKKSPKGRLRVFA